MLSGISVPLYIQLKELILNQIKDGTLVSGERLPSERELCEKYNVSRITVRQALNELSTEGLIYRSHGKGTFVSETKVEQQLISITPFQHSLLNKGFKPKTKILDYKTLPNSYKISKQLEISLSEEIFQLNLLGLNDEVPMVYYSSFFEYEFGLKMKDIALTFVQEGKSFSTLDLYKYLPEQTLGVVNQTFEASIADGTISSILNVKKGSPILIVESLIYSSEDIPLECRTSIYRGDKYKFSIIRKP